jgi:hypothetical protein
VGGARSVGQALPYNLGRGSLPLPLCGACPFVGTVVFLFSINYFREQGCPLSAHCEPAIRPNPRRKRTFFSMSSVKPVVKARRQVRQLRTLPTPVAHTRTSGTALEPTRHEHPGWQREEWFPAHETSQRACRPSWPMAAPSGKNA